jgi:hypothetical protein
MVTQEIKILKSKKEGFLKSVAKFNKKALKLGVVPMDVEFGEEVRTSYYASEEAEVWGVLSYHVYQEVTVSYEVPKIDGWDLVCIFDYESYETEEEEVKKAVFMSKVPDKVVPVEYQDKEEIHCEHCGHNRYRVKSYLVQHEESGEYKEVGSTCLKDFLGHDPNSFLWFAQVETRIKEWSDEFSGWAVGDPIAYSVHGILALSSAMMEKYGWVSRSDQYHDMTNRTVSTADMVESYLTQKNKNESEKIYPTDADNKIAEDTIEYFKNADNQDNDYLMNCKKIVEIDRVPFRKLGLACSMVKSYRNHLEYLIRQEMKANEKESNWFGEVGDKLVKVKVKCVFKTHVDTMYGSSTLYKWIDPESGNVYKTFYSGYTWECEQDEEVLLCGTVKKHDEWNEKKENLLTRCKVFEIEPIS